MNETNHEEAYLAGRLIQWGLRVKVIPFNEEEYRDLIDRYIDRPSFRSMVRQFAEGLGLVVLDVSQRGLFLGTADDSIFAQKPSEFRSGGSGSAEDRLMDGLVQVAIAATIYPRQQDLDEDSIEAKPPITASEVDETLRALCAEHKRRVAGEPDVDTDAVDQGLLEAWRVYESRPGVKTTQKGKMSASATQSLIRKHLQSLVEHGCFVVSKQGMTELYRPTLRYQVQVRELAATRMYQQIQSLLDVTLSDASSTTEVADA